MLFSTSFLSLNSDPGLNYTEYLELFLAMIEDDPLATTNKCYQVFISEQRLYGSDKTTNHRIRDNNIMIYERLFRAEECDTSILHPLLKAGACNMRQKLTDYAKNRLPGGIYWEPPPAVEAILRDIKPNNDVCESILGLNDYLSTAIPTNLHAPTLLKLKKWNFGMVPEPPSRETKLCCQGSSKKKKTNCSAV